MDRALVSAGLVPRLDMRYRAGSRRKEFVETDGCLVCGAGNAGLVETNVGIFGAWRLYGGAVEKRMRRWPACGDPLNRMGKHVAVELHVESAIPYGKAACVQEPAKPMGGRENVWRNTAGVEAAPTCGRPPGRMGAKIA